MFLNSKLNKLSFLVYGLGLTGQSVVKFFKRNKIKNYTVWDDNNKKLFKNIVEEKEEKRFLDLIDNLSNLNQDEVKRLNVNCKEGFLNLDNNKIKGIY